MTARNPQFQAITALILMSASLSMAKNPPGSADAISRLVSASKGQAVISLHPATGRVRFVKLPSSSLKLLGNSPNQVAESFFRDYGEALGLGDPTQELLLRSSSLDDLGSTHLNFDQVYRGIPVFAGHIKVHFDPRGNLRVVNGTIIPDLQTLDITPTITAAKASARAINIIKKSNGAGARPMNIEDTTLMVFRSDLARRIPGPNHLVWEVEISDGLQLREFVFVDAHTGKAIDQITGIPDAMYRRAFDSEANFPASPFWTEGEAFPTGTAEADHLISGSSDAYSLYWNAFARDAYDGAGATMENIFNRTFSCPNASWNGTNTSYCPGFTADDIVAHEWTHAYTQYTHNLIYQWQPGALNEAYSDIFGETVDQINGSGTDAPNAARTPGACSSHGGSPPPSLTINAPAGLAGSYAAAPVIFNPPGPLTVTSTVEVVDDQTDTTSDGCEAFVGFTPGNIALVDRSWCAYDVKVTNAYNAGASGVIIANNAGDGLFVASGSVTDPLPTVMVGQTDGATLRSVPGVNATIELFSSTDDSVLWLMGEDLTGEVTGANRDLWNPNCFFDPGKVSDEAQYQCDEGDHGGVHTNSGIPNHAFALVVDGGTYNGHSISGIGLTKAAHIYWRAMSVYQVPDSDFSDHADALEASCSDLIGTNLADLQTGLPSGEIIQASDCTQVSAAAAAVELRTPPAFCNFQPMLNPDAPAQDCVVETFFEDFETDPAERWILSNEGVYAEYTPRDWQWTSNVPSGGSGHAFFAENDPDLGDCTPGSDDQSGVVHLESPSIVLGANPVLSFDHWVSTESGYDGGNVKISVNGGAFEVIQPYAFTFNAYNSSLNTTGNTNPLAGEAAFTGTNGGSVTGSWGQSQVDLGSYASTGDTVRLRFDFGMDGCGGITGWYIDKVRVCSSSAPAHGVRLDSASSAHTGDDAAVLSWTHSTSGEDRIMIVGITTRSNHPATGVSYGGQPLTKIRRDHTVWDVGTELWYRIAPLVGSHSVTVTIEASTTIEAGATTWVNVPQAPAEAFGADGGAGAGGSSPTASVTLPGAEGEIIVDMVGTQANWVTVTPGAGQTLRWSELGSWANGACSSKAGGASTTMSWSLSANEYWSISAVALKATPAGLFLDGFESGNTTAWSAATP